MKNKSLICPLCSVSISDPVIAGDFVYGGRAEQKFYSCPACEVAFLSPPMSVEDEKNFYRKEFEKFMEGRSGKDSDWTGPKAHIEANQKQYERRLRFLSDLINPGLTALEVGCSSGFMLLAFKDKGMKVAGIEPSGSFTSFLKNQSIPVYVSLEDFKALNPGQTFDLVCHFFVLEHIRKPVEFLKETLSLVKPGGYLVFEVPSRDDPLITIYNIPAFNKFYWSVAHHYYFNRRSLEYVLNKVGEEYQIIPEQRYDLSNHFMWAIYGKPGGQGRYSNFYTKELDKAYKDSMTATGKCDALVVRIKKGG